MMRFLQLLVPLVVPLLLVAAKANINLRVVALALELISRILPPPRASLAPLPLPPRTPKQSPRALVRVLLAPAALDVSIQNPLPLPLRQAAPKATRNSPLTLTMPPEIIIPGVVFLYPFALPPLVPPFGLPLPNAVPIAEAPPVLVPLLKLTAVGTD